jgi:hypothetical protein
MTIVRVGPPHDLLPQDRQSGDLLALAIFAGAHHVVEGILDLVGRIDDLQLADGTGPEELPPLRPRSRSASQQL